MGLATEGVQRDLLCYAVTYRRVQSRLTFGVLRVVICPAAEGSREFEGGPVMDC